MYYLFSYGSLISEVSRKLSGVLSSSFPARVSRIKRGWYLTVPEDKDTGLGATSDKSSLCNGVLINTNTADIELLDKREKIHGYRRVQLPLESILLPYGRGLGNLEELEEIEGVWAYITDLVEFPTETCPIAQSYLDVVLEGCLAISKEFAEEFILSTEGWESPWVNDRENPRYRRFTNTDIIRIDTLLEQTIPNYFLNRKNVTT